MKNLLSILSRFYFYMILHLLQEKNLLPFNPIKVLFLRVYWNGTTGNIGNFQSYQGSIFTAELTKTPLFPINLSILSRFYFYPVTSAWCVSCHESFQSYQGSIFTRTQVHSLQLMQTFNPIKVLFLLRIEFLRTASINLLSILSRFYFYPVVDRFRCQVLVPFNPIKVLFLHFQHTPTEQAGTLSILSRFYFYV